MMITLYIALWLLSGFLAAWVAHNLEQKYIYPKATSVFAVVCMTSMGVCSIALVILYCIFELGMLKTFLNKPFFKAKEPK